MVSIRYRSVVVSEKFGRELSLIVPSGTLGYRSHTFQHTARRLDSSLFTFLLFPSLATPNAISSVRSSKDSSNKVIVTIG